MIISFHKVFILTRSLLHALRNSFSKSHGFDKTCDQEISPDVVTQPNTASRVRAGEAEFESDVGLRFFPPVYVQRYLAVQDILVDDKWGGKIKKVIDFGCAEFGFFSYAKHVPGVEEILTVDIDEELLLNHRSRIAPLTSDYLSSRSAPLTVQVFVGSIAKLDKCLLGCDAVVCIEIIEHLWPEEVESVPYTVFGFIKPKVAIFTTPNSDFNVLFPNFTGFRHFDHKFEWSREQFECWAANITTRYPDYEVTIEGIGPGPLGTEKYGHCSQMAVFVKRTPCSDNPTENVPSTQPEGRDFKLLFEYNYPFRADNRTDKEKICQEAEYYIRMYGSVETYCNEAGIIEIPLRKLMPNVVKWCDSQATLRTILEENAWEMSETDTGETAVIYPWYSRSDFSSSEDEGQDEETSVTIMADEAEYVACPDEYEEWGLDEVVVPSSTEILSNSSGQIGNTSVANPDDIRVCDMSNSEDVCEPVFVNDPLIKSYLAKSNSNALNGSNLIKPLVAEELIHKKADQARQCFLTDPDVFQLKENAPNHETLPQANVDPVSLSLNGQPLDWKLVPGDANLDSDEHETPSVSGEWGVSSPELVSCTSLLSQGSASFCSAISGDFSLASDLDSDQEMDLSLELDAADSDSDGSQGEVRIDNPRRVQQHRGNFPFGLNAVVENGDVANNNRDGEGNNAIAFGVDQEIGNFQLFEEEAGDHEVAEGFIGEEESDDEDPHAVVLDYGDPFPLWLLRLLNLINEGGELGGAGEPQWFVNDG